MKNYLTATIKVPVKITQDGEFIMLDNYADISLAPMTVEPRETFHTLHEKLVEYIHEHPEYLTQVLRETYGFSEASVPYDPIPYKQTSKQKSEDQTCEQASEEQASDEASEEQASEQTETTITNDTVLHAFPYFKKSKKPINMSFRNRGARHNFTKKTYN